MLANRNVAILVKDEFDYNPETGLLTWKVSAGPCKAGNRAGTWVGDRLRVGWLKQYHPATHIIWLWMTGKWPDKVVDHKDGNPSNDKWNNLQNIYKCQDSSKKVKQSNNKSGIPGVHYCNWRKRWIVQRRQQGKPFLGKSFTKYSEAIDYLKSN